MLECAPPGVRPEEKRMRRTKKAFGDVTRGLAGLLVGALLPWIGTPRTGLAQDSPPPPPPKDTAYAALTVLVVESVGGRDVPLPGASILVRCVQGKAGETVRWPCGKEQTSKTSRDGRCVLNDPAFLGSGYGARATIPRNRVVEVSVRVSADAYASERRECVLTFDRPTRELTVRLRRGKREEWILDEKDEIAAEGRVVVNSRRDRNVTSYPVVRVKVLAQDGTPLLGATVRMWGQDATRQVAHDTDDCGDVVFHPRDFARLGGFTLEGDRAVLVGTQVDGTRKAESQGVNLCAECMSYEGASEVARVETFQPLTRVVFHLIPRRSTDRRPTREREPAAGEREAHDPPAGATDELAEFEKKKRDYCDINFRFTGVSGTISIVVSGVHINDPNFEDATTILATSAIGYLLKRGSRWVIRRDGRVVGEGTVPCEEYVTVTVALR
jgi:hypothetical protein